jgi:GH43 family beta-xylosidase
VNTVNLVNDFYPIIDQNGGDPWIIQNGEWYYYTKTTGDNVTIWRSPYLSTVAAGEPQIIFSDLARFDSIWAPELHRYEGNWVVYFAASKGEQPHRMYALLNTNADPLSGQWVCSEIKGMDKLFAIDATLLSVTDRHYLIWSGCPVEKVAPQYLYIAELTKWNQLKGPKVLLSVPEFPWEMRQGAPINEGPEVIIRNETINLIYSASPSWENGYCLGLLTATVHTDLLKRSNWKKKEFPIFDASTTVYSPGHCGFVGTKDGKEKWMIFHAARWSHSGFKRSIRLQPFSFNAKNEVSYTLPEPAISGVPLQLPSGDSPRYRLSAEQIYQKCGEVLEFQAIEAETSILIQTQLDFTFEVAVAGEYRLAFYLHNPRRETSFATFKINNVEVTKEIIPSDFYQPVYLTVHTNQLRNVVHVSTKEALYLSHMDIILPEGVQLIDEKTN